MVPLRTTLASLVTAGALFGAVTASATTGRYQLILSLDDQTTARHVLLRSGLDLKMVPTDFYAISQTPEACRGFHPRRGDLVVSGLGTAAGTRASAVDRIRVKIFRTAQMAHADWQRNAAAPAEQRCRLALLRSSGDVTPKARKIRLARVARYQTAFLGTGQARAYHPNGVLPSYRWDVVLVKGRTEIELGVLWVDTKGNNSDIVADLARDLLSRAPS